MEAGVGAGCQDALGVCGVRDGSDEMSDGNYRTVVADPPWPSMHQRSTYHRGKPERHYPTMPVEEIAALPVGNLASSGRAPVDLGRQPAARIRL